MAEIGLVASVAGLISLAIQVTGVTQKFAIGVKEAPKIWRVFIEELKCLPTALIDLKDNIVENPELMQRPLCHSTVPVLFVRMGSAYSVYEIES